MFLKIIQALHNANKSENSIKYIFLELRKIFFQYFPYIKYIYDKKYNSLWNNYYYNFWRTCKEDFWLNPFIEMREINKYGKPIDFISVMWPRKVVKYLKNKKIFFTWEDIWKDSIHWLFEYEDYLLNDVDLSIWFREYDNKNYIRFPLWIMQLVDPRMRYHDIEERINEINNRNDIKRDKFCTLIARYDKNWERRKIYNNLVGIGNIDCPSKFNNNCNISLPNYDDKRKFMEDYRFNVCLENHSVKWYVTEKLIDAFRSKCIPIYNWILTDFDKKIINEDAIISTLDPNWIDKVKEIEFSDKKYKEFISIKPFKKDSTLILSNFINHFEHKLRSILE